MAEQKGRRGAARGWIRPGMRNGPGRSSRGRSAGEGDRHEQGGVVDPRDGVGLVGLKVEQVAGAQLAGLASVVKATRPPGQWTVISPRPEWVGTSLPRGTTGRITSRPPV